MAFLLVKILLTAALVVAVSEIARRSTLFAAVLASVPLTSVLAMVWLYIDTRDVTRVSALASGIFWMVIPSLTLFVTLPLLLRQGVNFYLALGLSLSATAACYFLLLSVLANFGINLNG